MPVNDIVTRSDAGALMPEEVATDIIRAIPSQSVALSQFRTVTMSRGVRRLPVLQTLPQAYFVNGDTGLKQTTKLAWGNKFLTAEEIAVLLPIPDNVVNDSDFDLWEEARPDIIRAVGRVLDAAVLFGVGAPGSWDDSVVPGAEAAGNTFVRGSVADQDVAEDINQVMALVEDDGFEVNGHAARVRLKSTLRGLRDDNNRPIYNDPLPDGTPGTLYGEQIRYVNSGAWDNDAADLVSGDWDQAILGIRQDISFRVFTEGVISDDEGNVVLNLMQQDASALRLTFRVGFAVANPITGLNEDVESRFPFAVLRPAGWTE